jgi:hypothetical protein
MREAGGEKREAEKNLFVIDKQGIIRYKYERMPDVALALN